MSTAYPQMVLKNTSNETGWAKEVDSCEYAKNGVYSCIIIFLLIIVFSMQTNVKLLLSTPVLCVYLYMYAYIFYR